jgi:hypothetical protein
MDSYTGLGMADGDSDASSVIHQDSDDDDNPEHDDDVDIGFRQKVKVLGLNKFASRVSPEEEIELAKMIQKGAKLHGLKADFEADHGRKPNKSEWAKLAGLESPTQLRRVVVDYCHCGHGPQLGRP